MVRSIRSLGLQGVTGYLVTAECDLSGGLPAFTVVGLPDAAVNEARERVRSAIKNCGFTFPVSRITVNLAPAHLKKVGTLYDLPMLVGILAAGKQLRLPEENCAFVGELSLSGQLRPCAGMLSLPSTSPPRTPPKPPWPRDRRSTPSGTWPSWSATSPARSPSLPPLPGCRGRPLSTVRTCPR